jgi:peptidoglycan/LPS O-acetylase OafA/YrhL
MCYSLYLTHPLVAVPVAWACYRAGLTTPAATVLVTLPLCALLAVGLGYAFHLAVERRFLNPPPIEQCRKSVACQGLDPLLVLPSRSLRSRGSRMQPVR